MSIHQQHIKLLMVLRIYFNVHFQKKIFLAFARHIFIVAIRWIEECLLQDEFVDETPFEILGDNTVSTMHLASYRSDLPLFSPAT